MAAVWLTIRSGETQHKKIASLALRHPPFQLAILCNTFIGNHLVAGAFHAPKNPLLRMHPPQSLFSPNEIVEGV
jgi:hypothetical protein